MKKIFSFLLLSGLLMNSAAQKVDTTYYDKNWQGVKYKELAQYLRYDFIFNDSRYDDKTRIFYIGGQVEREGTPLSFDKYDGTKAKWKGELLLFYPNGSKKQVCNFDNTGALQGKNTQWFENGTLQAEENYENGFLQGQSVVYDAGNPDIAYVTQFVQGKPLNNETMIYYSSGRAIRADFETKKMITLKPVSTDCKSKYKDGIASWYYDINGIYVSLNFTKSKQYGKYYQCFIQFYNNTNDPIEINPENISGKYIKGGDARDIVLMPAEEYLKKIARMQKWGQAMAGFSSGMATYNAGYSTSTTNATAVGSGGYAMGTSTTTTYNPYQKQAIINQENQKLANQAAADKQVKDAIDGSILKRTVVEPGEELIKSFFIDYLSADKLIINLEINDIIYPFEMEKM